MARRARAEWMAGDETAAITVTWPVPEVPCRSAREEEFCRSARAIRALAEVNGWLYAATYTRGTRPGRIPRVVNSLALRLKRDGVLMWAVWLDDKFDAAMLWAPCGVPTMVNLTEVRREIGS